MTTHHSSYSSEFASSRSAVGKQCTDCDWKTHALLPFELVGLNDVAIQYKKKTKWLQSLSIQLAK